jgi:hypothetical protein
MKSKVQTALDDIVNNVTALDHASGAGRVFELYVMTSLARGLQNAGFSVWLQRSDGTPILPTDTDRRFIQRGGSPTGVAAASDGPNNASVIGFPRSPRQHWEIWNGIQFAGRSSAKHEIDISIVPGSVGSAIRARGGIPVGRPRVAIECKDVVATGGLDEMRAFIARLYDMTLLRAHHTYLTYPHARALHPNSPDEPKHRATITYWQENRRCKNIIARKAGFSSGTAPFGAYHHIEPHSGIEVGSSAVNDFVGSVIGWAKRVA